VVAMVAEAMAVVVMAAVMAAVVMAGARDEVVMGVVGTVGVELVERCREE